MRNAPFRVTEKQSGRDITGAVLLQVVGDAERSDAPLMTRDYLMELIRQHDSCDRPVLGKYLEQCLQLFAVSHPVKATEAAEQPNVATSVSPSREQSEAA